MNSNFWQSSNYGSQNECDQESAQNIASPFSNHLRNLEFNTYDASNMFGSQNATGNMAATERNQLPSNATMTQAIPPSSMDVHYRMASMGHTPNDALYQSTHLGPNTSLPGLGLSSNLSNPSSSFPLLHNPTLYAPSHDVSSYNIAHATTTTTTAGTLSASYHTFSPHSIFEHRSYLGAPQSIHSGMPPPPPLSHQRHPPLFSASPPLMPVAALRQDYPPAAYHSNRYLQSSVNPFQLSTSSPTSPSPPLAFASRGPGSGAEHTSPAGTSSYGYGVSNPLHVEIPHTAMEGKDVPPFEPTTELAQLFDSTGHHISQELHATIDKGFFRADSDWCCYRRNYFSVACSYNLTSSSRGGVDHENVYLMRDGHREVVHGFYVCIAATVDGEDGRAIELVQYTPKRDKQPVFPPERRLLRPNSSGNLHIFSGASSSSFDSPHHLLAESIKSELHPTYQESYQPNNPQDIPNTALFDRVQFKKATANNGKRRAAQQYFHIVVELYAKVRRMIGGSGGAVEDFIKISHRISAQMVVRGRSPGHYADGTRTSSNLGGGTGSAGGGGGGGYGSMPRDHGSSAGMGTGTTGVLPGQYLNRGGSGTSSSSSSYHHHPRPRDVVDLYRGLSSAVTAELDDVLCKQEHSTHSTGLFPTDNTMSPRHDDDESRGEHYYRNRNTSKGGDVSPYHTPDAWCVGDHFSVSSRGSPRQYYKQEGVSPLHPLLLST